MLVALAIRDFAIVDRLDLEFEPGFTALTGETGAGKSILIDALALALGERADPTVVRAGAERAEVTAEFALERLPDVQQWLADGALEGDPGRLLLRRVVERGGRSRAFVNGTAATVQQLRRGGRVAGRHPRPARAPVAHEAGGAARAARRARRARRARARRRDRLPGVATARPGARRPGDERGGAHRRARQRRLAGRRAEEARAEARGVGRRAGRADAGSRMPRA